MTSHIVSRFVFDFLLHDGPASPILRFRHLQSQKQQGWTITTKKWAGQGRGVGGGGRRGLAGVGRVWRGCWWDGGGIDSSRQMVWMGMKYNAFGYYSLLLLPSACQFELYCVTDDCEHKLTWQHFF